MDLCADTCAFYAAWLDFGSMRTSIDLAACVPELVRMHTNSNRKCRGDHEVSASCTQRACRMMSQMLLRPEASRALIRQFLLCTLSMLMVRAQRLRRHSPALPCICPATAQYLKLTHCISDPHVCVPNCNRPLMSLPVHTDRIHWAHECNICLFSCSVCNAHAYTVLCLHSNH